MLETGTPEHNLVNRLTPNIVKIIHVAKKCEKSNCEFRHLLGCSADEIKHAINEYGNSVKVCSKLGKSFCKFYYCPLSDECEERKMLYDNS